MICRILRQNLLIISKSVLDSYVSDDHAVPGKHHTAGFKMGFLFWRVDPTDRSLFYFSSYISYRSVLKNLLFLVIHR